MQKASSLRWCHCKQLSEPPQSSQFGVSRHTGEFFLHKWIPKSTLALPLRSAVRAIGSNLKINQLIGIQNVVHQLQVVGFFLFSFLLPRKKTWRESGKCFATHFAQTGALPLLWIYSANFQVLPRYFLITPEIYQRSNLEDELSIDSWFMVLRPITTHVLLMQSSIDF